MKRYISIYILLCFVVTSVMGPCPVYAQEFLLPAPGARVLLSPQYNPPILKGIKVHPNNPFKFDFILDKGDSVEQGQIKTDASRLIKYFLTSLTIPEKDLWVNLSPYEKNRIVPESFGQTEMGRDLLAEDYMLKQITASLIYPEDEIGKKFWKRIYEEAYKKFGTTNIPVNTFNKVWIVPEKAVVYENVKAGTAYVVTSTLKVMLEQDYLALSHNVILSGTKDLKAPLDSSAVPQNDMNALGSQIIREIVIPELTKEVNEDKNFAKLRQVYNSLILASWYKKKIKDSILTQVYAGRNKIAGVNTDNPQEKEKIYQRYLQAFKKGVYNYVKEDIDPVTQETTPRKYFSGGMGFDAAQLNPVESFTENATVLPDAFSNDDVITAGMSPINDQAMIKVADSGGYWQMVYRDGSVNYFGWSDVEDQAKNSFDVFFRTAPGSSMRSDGNVICDFFVRPVARRFEEGISESEFYKGNISVTVKNGKLDRVLDSKISARGGHFSWLAEFLDKKFSQLKGHSFIEEVPEIQGPTEILPSGEDLGETWTKYHSINGPDRKVWDDSVWPAVKDMIAKESQDNKVYPILVVGGASMLEAQNIRQEFPDSVRFPIVVVDPAKGKSSYEGIPGMSYLQAEAQSLIWPEGMARPRFVIAVRSLEYTPQIYKTLQHLREIAESNASFVLLMNHPLSPSILRLQMDLIYGQGYIQTLNKGISYLNGQTSLEELNEFVYEKLEEIKEQLFRKGGFREVLQAGLVTNRKRFNDVIQKCKQAKMSSSEQIVGEQIKSYSGMVRNMTKGYENLVKQYGPLLDIRRKYALEEDMSLNEFMALVHNQGKYSYDSRVEHAIENFIKAAGFGKIIDSRTISADPKAKYLFFKIRNSAQVATLQDHAMSISKNRVIKEFQDAKASGNNWIAQTVWPDGRVEIGGYRFTIGRNYKGTNLRLYKLKSDWEQGLRVFLIKNGKEESLGTFYPLLDDFRPDAIYRQTDEMGRITINRLGYKRKGFLLGRQYGYRQVIIYPYDEDWKKGCLIFSGDDPIAIYLADKDMFSLLEKQILTDDKGRFGYQNIRYSLGSVYANLDLVLKPYEDFNWEKGIRVFEGNAEIASYVFKGKDRAIESTWETLEKEGYSVDEHYDDTRKGEAPQELDIVLKKDGQRIETAYFSFDIFLQQKIIYIRIFDPDFPNNKVGRGRALLRHILDPLRYGGFQVMAYANTDFSNSLVKMKDFQMEPGKANVQLSAAFLKGLTLQQQRWLGKVIEDSNIHGIVPAPSNRAMNVSLKGVLNEAIDGIPLLSDQARVNRDFSDEDLFVRINPDIAWKLEASVSGLLRNAFDRQARGDIDLVLEERGGREIISVKNNGEINWKGLRDKLIELALAKRVVINKQALDNIQIFSSPLIKETQSERVFTEKEVENLDKEKLLWVAGLTTKRIGDGLYGGRGEELSYIYHAVKEMGGQIDVTSGAETEFSISLPGDLAMHAEIKSFEEKLIAQARDLGYMVNEQTKFVLQLGDTLDKSKYYRVFNKAFEIGKDNIILLPIKTMPDELAYMMKMGRLSEKVSGFNITSPHKIEVMHYVDSFDDISKKSGAVDAILKQKDGTLKGYNYDGEQWVYWYTQFLGKSLSNKKMVILGAGGAARAVVFSILQKFSDTHITIQDWQEGVAESLVRDFKQHYPGSDLRAVASSDLNDRIKESDVVINLTGSGKSYDDRTPSLPDIDYDLLKGKEAIDANYRFQYKGSSNEFLTRAKAAGAQIYNGLGFSVGSVPYMYHLFTAKQVDHHFLMEFAKAPLSRGGAGMLDEAMTSEQIAARINVLLKSKTLSLKKKIELQDLITQAHAITKEIYTTQEEQYRKVRKPYPAGVDLNALEAFVKRMHVSKAGPIRILDVGTGIRDMRWFANQPDLSATGIDISPTVVASINKELGKRPGINSLVMDMTKLKFPDNSFDGVRAWGSLHHLPLVNKSEGMDVAVREFYRVLKPGGECDIFVKARSVGREGFSTLDTKEGLSSRFYYFLSRPELIKLLRRNGFEVNDKDVELVAGYSAGENWLVHATKPDQGMIAKKVIGFSASRILQRVKKNRQRDQELYREIGVKVGFYNSLFYYMLLEAIGLDDDYAHKINLDKLYLLNHQSWSIADDITARYGNLINKNEWETILTESKEKHIVPFIPVELLKRKGVSIADMKAIPSSNIPPDDHRNRAAILEEVQGRMSQTIASTPLSPVQRRGVMDAFQQSTQKVYESFYDEKVIGLYPSLDLVRRYLRMKTSDVMVILMRQLQKVFQSNVEFQKNVRMMDIGIYLLQAMDDFADFEEDYQVQPNLFFTLAQRHPQEFERIEQRLQHDHTKIKIGELVGLAPETLKDMNVEIETTYNQLFKLNPSFARMFKTLLDAKYSAVRAVKASPAQLAKVQFSPRDQAMIITAAVVSILVGVIVSHWNKILISKEKLVNLPEEEKDLLLSIFELSSNKLRFPKIGKFLKERGLVQSAELRPLKVERKMISTPLLRLPKEKGSERLKRSESYMQGKGETIVSGPSYSRIKEFIQDDSVYTLTVTRNDGKVSHFVIMKNAFDGRDIVYELDKAMIPATGGIDLTAAKMNVETKAGSSTEAFGDDKGIQLHLDPAMLAQLQNAEGFVPVIISIRPMTDLKAFLGAA